MSKNNKLLNVVLFLIIFGFILSLIPILYVAQFDFATGDDLGYGAAVRHAWIENKSIIACISAAFSNVKNSYTYWQGTWFTLFIFCFNPENFGFGHYAIVPYIMVFLQISCMLLVMHRLLVYRLQLSKLDFLGISFLILFENFQFIEYPTCGFYWWTGTVHYIIPFSLFLLSMFWADRYLEKYKIADLICLSICMLFIGGGSYQPAILALLSVVLLDLWRKVIYGKNKEFKAFFIFIPVLIEIIGIIISAKAPGNKVRGGDGFGFTSENIFSAILGCFVTAIEWIQDCCINNSAIIAIMLFCAVIIGVLLNKSRVLSKQNFKFPLLFVIMNFCLFAAVFTPELFAGVDVSGGLYNTYLYVFVLTLLADIIYLEGYFLTKIQGGFRVRGFIGFLAMFLFIIAELLLIYEGRHGIKETTDYVCFEYVSSGAAMDYKNQMIQYYEILTSTDKDIVLPTVNNEQGPLQCMPITDDISNFTNTVTAEYYYKNTVTAIPREEWNSLYNVEK